MKNSTASNRKTGRMIAKNLIILVVLVFVSILAMWAWFTNKSSATADGIDVNCNAPDGVEIAIVEHGKPAPGENDYKTSLHLNSENYDFISNLYMTEVTSDGINDNFLRPALTQTGNKASVNTEADWDDATENKDFLSFDLYFRSKSSQKICMSSASSIKPESKKLVWNDGESTAGYNPSNYGNFSRDCIVGAVRFSIVSTSKTRQMLWIPAPNIKLSENGDYVLTTLVSGDTYSHTYYKTTKEFDKLSGAAVVANNQRDYTLGANGEAVKILELTAKDTTGFYVNHVTCNMWIEGEDDESRLALVNGKYKVDLKFVIME
ncbi:MAG TPA: hypothetical protein DE313_02295 [Ruminococcus sp.]|nr:hypothetical protein [Ruminococcus sp.]